MKAVHLKNILNFILLLLAAISLRLMIIYIHEYNNEKKVKELTYKEVQVQNSNIVYKKLEFNREELNKFIDDYIDENACMTFEYNVFRIGEDKINIYVNCGTPKNIIYDYKEEIEISFNELILNEEKFNNKIKELLNLKYPTFVSEEVDIKNGIYNIYSNEIILYCNTNEFNIVSIKINNNEIKDLVNYEMTYDEYYENEKFELDPSKKTIAFSFDDGPSTYDLGIINALVEAHSTATFFIVGNRINNYKSSVEAMISNNMEVGNHSYDHKYMGKMDLNTTINELTRTNEIFKNLTGNELKLFRPPYGVVKSSYLFKANVPSIMWSLDTLDWKSRDADKVYNTIIENVSDGDIILMHSLYPSTLEAVKRVIPELYKQGYQIVSVSELANIKGKSIEIGNSYVSFK